MNLDKKRHSSIGLARHLNRMTARLSVTFMKIKIY